MIQNILLGVYLLGFWFVGYAAHKALEKQPEHAGHTFDNTCAAVIMGAAWPLLVLLLIIDRLRR